MNNNTDKDPIPKEQELLFGQDDLDEDEYLDDEPQRKPKGKRLRKFRGPQE